MLTLQTTRHTTDYTFTLVKTVRESTLRVGRPRPRRRRHGGRDGPESAAERAVRASERSNERPWVNWTKKAIHLPIGERWLVISVGRRVRHTPAGLPGAARARPGRPGLHDGGPGAARAHLGRPRRRATSSATSIRAQLDRGPLAAARLAGRRRGGCPSAATRGRCPRCCAWSSTPWCCSSYGPSRPTPFPAAFALLFAVAYHHYDALYRVLNGLPPRTVSRTCSAWASRAGSSSSWCWPPLGDEASVRGAGRPGAVARLPVFVVVGMLGGLRALRPRA